MIAESILEQIIQGIASAVWNRSKIKPLREQIESLLRGSRFKVFTREALESFQEQIGRASCRERVC